MSLVHGTSATTAAGTGPIAAVPRKRLLTAIWGGVMLFVGAVAAASYVLVERIEVDAVARSEERAVRFVRAAEASINRALIGIDLVLAGAPVAERVRAAWVDRQARKGTGPSDHAPVMVDLDEAPDGDIGPVVPPPSAPRPRSSTRSSTRSNPSAYGMPTCR